MTFRHRLRTVLTATAVTAGLLAVAGCSAAAGSAGGGQVNLVAYSTPQKVYRDLIPAFTATDAGRGATFHQSFGASGAQSRAVLAGQPADVVEFSLEPDMTRLVKAGLVDPDWNRNRYHGMVTDSVVVLLVRKGNPAGVHGWADLVRPGVQVVTPNPFSSGSAQWNLMAAYGSQIKQGRTPNQALAYVKAMLKNTVAQPESGSKATAAFVAGTGDVLISYENEAIEAQHAGQAVDYVIPDQTLLIENPVAAVARAGDRKLARAFVDFLYTEQAQRTFAEHGYRPVLPAALDAARFPRPAHLFTIADLGGWPTVTKQFFDPTSGSIAKIETDLGVGGG